MDSCLRVALWNANGMVQHYHEIKIFLMHQKIDILLVSETHFSDRSYFRIPNYNLYCTNHPNGRARGGAAVLVKSSLQHYELVRTQLNYLQASSVVILTRTGPVAMSAVYCPPPYIINKDQFVDFFNSLGTKFIVGGDFNAKHLSWGSRLTTSRGREMFRAINEANLTAISSGEPTYWPSDINKNPDLLDFFIAKGIPDNCVMVNSCLDLSSDHSPVLLSLYMHGTPKEKMPLLFNKNTNWQRFREVFNEELSLNVPLKNPCDIEEAVNLFTSKVQAAAWEATPGAYETTPITSGSNNCSIQVKKAIANKRRLRRIWQNTGNPEDKTNLNRAARNLRQLLKTMKNEWFSEYTSSLSPESNVDHSLWKSTRYLKRPIKHSPPIRKNDGSWAKSNDEKAAVFSDHLKQVFQPFPADPQNNIDGEVEEFLESPLQLSLPVRLFSPSEVKHAILTEINPNKAPGYDLIKGKVLRELPRKGYIFIAFIFNAILRLEYFPSLWKVGQIVVVPKPGKRPDLASSYRPITLLPILSKLFEKLFLKRLRPIIEQSNLIPDHQFGFRKQHSTIEQGHRIVNLIRQALEKKQYCSAVFLDVSQAFDKVWHTGLLFKLKNGLPHSYFNILKSYLYNRYFQVKFSNVLTDLCLVESGVPQGSVLGPILYTLYTSDMPSAQNVTTATFADDTAVLSSHENPQIASENLQDIILDVERWLKVWRIKVNETKSVHLTFTLRRETCPGILLNNTLLPQSESVKYLGIHLDRRLTWHTHIWQKRQQLNLKFNDLWWLIGSKSKLSMENKLLIYKVILKPVWTYGCQLWGSASTSNIEIIQRFQSKCLRKITCAPWYISNVNLHRDLKMPFVKEEISRFSQRYQRRLYCHPNHLALNLLDNSDQVQRLKRCAVLELADRFL